MLVLIVVILLGASVAYAQQPVINNYWSTTSSPGRGESFTFFCGSPDTVKWFKSPVRDKRFMQEIIFPNQDFEMDDAKSLVVQSADPDKHNGFYICSATNAVNTTMPPNILTCTVKFINDYFEYTPRNTFFYNGIPGLKDSSKLAWANCKPPKASPNAIPKWINGSSGLEVTALTDSRVEVRQLSNEGLISQIVINNANKYDVGVWSCRVVHALGTLNSYFNVTLYGPPKGVTGLHVSEHRLNGFVMKWDYLRNDLFTYNISVMKTSTNEVKYIEMREHRSFVIYILEYTLTGLELGTEYRISLRATDDKGQIGEWSAPLVVTTVSHLAPLILEHPPTQHIGEKKQFTITCGVQALPAATFQWFRNDKLITSADSRYKIENEKLIMTSPLRGEDNHDATYKCKATNQYGSAESKGGTIAVEWIDVDWKLLPSNRAFYAGESFVRLSAIPPNGRDVDVIWVKVDEERTYTLPNPNYPNANPTLYRNPIGTLTWALDIRNVAPRFRDGYQVIAKNLAAERVHEFSMVQSLAPPAITTLKNTSVTGASITFEWDPPLSRASLFALGERYKYRLDIGQFDFSITDTKTNTERIVSADADDVEYTDKDFFRRRYRLSGLIGGVEYVYKIRAVDNGKQAGTWSPGIVYTIPGDLPPYILQGPKLGIKVEEGHNLTLDCIVAAKPPFNVTWFHNDKEIAFSDLIIQSEDKLLLMNVTQNQKGLYYCSASNQYGSSQSSNGSVEVLYFNDKYVYTKGIAPVYNTPSFTQVRILCIPPESNPEAGIFWSNSTHDFIDFKNTDFVKDDKYILDGVTYFSFIIKNPMQYLNLKVGCASYNPKFGFNNRYKIAITTLTLYAKPILSSPVSYSWKAGPTLRVEWTKENAAFKSYSVTLLEDNDQRKVIETKTTADLFVEFDSVKVGVDYKIEMVVTDGENLKSDVTTVNIKGVTEQAIGAVPDTVKATTVQYSESSSINLQWDPPVGLSQDVIDKLTYSVKYCLQTDCKENRDKARNVTLSNLKVDTQYNYEIVVYSPAGVASNEKRTGTFKTEQKDSCEVDAFTCVTSKTCISKQSLCDGKYDCVDQSDEHADAGCVLPGKVEGLTAVKIMTTSITLTFNARPQKELVRYYLVENINSKEVKRVNASSVQNVMVTFTQLNAGTEYGFKVHAVNLVGVGVFSDEIKVTTVELPGAVKNININGKPQKESTVIQLSWTAPDAKAGQNVSSFYYLVEYCDRSTNNESCKNTTVTSSLSIEINGLARNTDYEIKIMSFNQENEAGETSMVSFKTAEFDTCLASQFRCTDSSCVSTTVLCNNVNDCADGSDETQAAGCSAPTSKPNIQGIALSSNSIRINWNIAKPGDNKHIQSYILENMNTTKQEEITVENNHSNMTMVWSNLSPSTIYQFRVRAKNLLGLGPWSDVLIIATKSAGLPGAVQDISSSPKQYSESSSVTLSWKPPAAKNGQVVSTFKYYAEYCLQQNDCKNTSLTVGTSVEITGLSGNQSYIVRVYAVNKAMEAGDVAEYQFKTQERDTCDTSKFFTCGSAQCVRLEDLCDNVNQCLDGSDETIKANCSTPIKTVSIPTVKDVSSVSIEIEWSGINDISERIRSYIVEMVDTTQQKIVNTTSTNVYSVVFDSLQPDTEYKFRVRAQNPSGLGPWSAMLITKILKPERPGVVNNLKAVPKLYAESTTLTITWQRPTNKSGQNVSTFSYLITYCKLIGSQLCQNTTLTTSLMMELDDLERRTAYSIAVTALDQQMQTGENVTTTVQMGARDTCPATHFACIVPQCIKREFLCDNQEQCTDGSDELLSAGCELPKIKPTITSVKTLSANSLQVEWNTISIASERVRSYILEMINANITVQVNKTGSNDQTTMKYIFKNLQQNTKYDFRLRSKNPSGLSEFSDIVSATTLKRELPGQVQNVAVTPKEFSETSTVIISWSPPVAKPGQNLATFKYLVEHCELNFPSTCQNGSVTASFSSEITGLSNRKLYQYKIYTLNENMEHGEAKEDAFKTAERDTCRSTQFACGNPQCVPKLMLCDGRTNCADGSDEKAVAGCKVPLIAPTITSAVSVSPRVIEVEWNVIKVQSERVTSYIVEISTNEFNTSTHQQEIEAPQLNPAIVTLKTEFSNLEPGTAYIIQVRSNNPTGLGPWSGVSAVTTKSVPGVVQNVTATRKQYSESSTAILTWMAPVAVKGQDVSTFKYHVQFCEKQNASLCVIQGDFTTSLTYEVTGLLRKNLTYQYKITAYDSDDFFGEASQGIFVTAERDTCHSFQFTCGNPQCVNKTSICNNQDDCLDGSDETTAAGCVAPKQTPTYTIQTAKSPSALEIKWTTETNADDRIRSYLVENMNTSVTMEVDGPKLTPSTFTFVTTFDGLVPTSTYAFRMRAKNPSGLSPWSGVLILTTLGAIDKPSKVSFTTSHNTRTSVKISWLVNRTNPDALQYYQIENMNTSTTKRVDFNATTAIENVVFTIIDGLSGGVDYLFRMRAVNALGAGDWSDSVVARTAPGNPGEVSSVSVTPILYTETSAIKISWVPPLNLEDNRAERLTYTVKICLLNTIKCAKLAGLTDTTIEYKNLTRSTIYHYEILVFNELGEESPNVFSKPYTTPDRDTCQADEFVCGNPQCVANKFKCDGHVQCLDGSDETLKANCPLPSKMSPLVISEVKSSSIILKFDLVTALSQRITKYEANIVGTNRSIEIKHVGLVAKPEPQVVEFTGLEFDKEYEFRVRAINPSGPGGWSDAVSAKTLFEIGSPGAVNDVSYELIKYLETSSARVSWTVPTNLAFNDVTKLKYTVKYCAAEVCLKTEKLTDTNVLLSNLAKSTSYLLTVTVYNEKDIASDAKRTKVLTTATRDSCRSGFFACVSTPICIPTANLCDGVSHCDDSSDETNSGGCPVPPAPKNFGVGERTYHSIQVKWEVMRGEHRVLGYHLVDINNDENRTNIIQPSDPSIDMVTFTFNGLQANSQYKYRVRAVNPTGNSGWSNDLVVMTLPVPAKPPANLKLTAKSWNALQLDWDPYTSELEDRLVRYEVMVLNTDIAVKSLNVSKQVTSYIVDGLSEDVEYTIQLRAVSIGGYSQWVSEKAKTEDIGFPHEAANLKVLHTFGWENTNLTVTWETPRQLANNPVDEITFLFELCNSRTGSCTNEGNLTASPLLFGNLEPGIRYSYKMTTYRADGVKSDAVDGSITMLVEYKKPSPPQDVTITVDKSRTQMIASWKEPVFLAESEPDSLRYQVEICLKNTRVNCTSVIVNSTAVTFTGLLKDKNYEIHVAALSSRGEVGATQTETATTMEEEGELSTGIIIAVALCVAGAVVLIAAIVGYIIKTSKTTGAVTIGA